jgi:hypothetical protein
MASSSSTVKSQGCHTMRWISHLPVLYMLERFASVSTYLFGIDVKDMITYGYNVLLINSRFERAFDEGRVQSIKLLRAGLID